MMTRLVIAVFGLLFGVYAQAFDYWTEPNDTSYLEPIGTLPACDYIIDTVAKWANVNSPSYRVICVAPGDYTSLGRIALNVSGTASEKRWLRYYDPTGETADNVHPYHMSDAKRAKVSALYLNGASYWVLDRIYVKPVAAWANEAILTANSASHNVFNRLFVTDMIKGITIYTASSYNTIQHCVISNMRHGSDGCAVMSLGMTLPPAGQPKYNKIVSNECFDVNDCVCLNGFSPADSKYIGEEDYEGTVIYNNDMYLTSASYTDCNGTFTPTGDCACKENAVDIKSGTESSANPVVMAHNRMWGWRPIDVLDPTCWGPTGSSTTTVDAVVHFDTHNIRFEGNIFDDGSLTLSYGQKNITVKDNLIYTQYPAAGITGSEGWGIVFTAKQVESVALDGNVISEIRATPSFKSFNFQYAAQTSSTASFTNNVVINSNAPYTTAFAGSVSGNKYYNAPKPSWDTSPAAFEASVTGSGYDTQFCTQRKRITAPEQWCLDNAVLDTLIAQPTPPTPTRFWIID